MTKRGNMKSMTSDNIVDIGEYMADAGEVNLNRYSKNQNVGNTLIR